MNGVPYTPAFHLDPVLGPFVISPATAANGTSTLSFGLNGLSTGQVVTLTLEAVSLIDPSDTTCAGTVNDPKLVPGGNASFFFPSFWSFPDTEKPFRAIDIVVP